MSGEEIVAKKKINLIGDAGVGKTSLILRFVKNVFGEKYLKTIGSNVYTKTVPFEDGKVKLVIYDIMGEKKFNAVQKGAFKGSHGAIAVIDMLRPETLDSIIDDWLPRYHELSSEENPVIPVVNKYDLRHEENIPKRVKALPSDFDRIVFTSAKTGRNIEYVFKSIASQVAYNLQLSVQDTDDIVETKEIDSPQELLDVLLAVSSHIGDIPYHSREKMMKECGINKFDLEEDIKSLDVEEVLSFAESLKEFYRRDDEEQGIKLVNKALGKFDEFKI